MRLYLIKRWLGRILIPELEEAADERKTPATPASPLKINPQYVVIKEPSATKLTDRVEHAMKLGWQCQGGVSVYQHNVHQHNSEERHCQAMINMRGAS